MVLFVELLPSALLAAASLLGGYALGARRSRRSRRRLKRGLAACGLQALQADAERRRLLARLAGAPRRERLLRLLMRRLSASRDREHALAAEVSALRRRAGEPGDWTPEAAHPLVPPSRPAVRASRHPAATAAAAAATTDAATDAW